MSGSLQILRQELPLSDEQSQLMDIVLRESDRLNDTIRSFLAYARPQRNASAQARRAADGDRRRHAAAEQPGAARHARGPLRRAGRAGVVPRRRDPDPADRLEPGDQRAPRDGRGRGADARGHPRTARAGEARHDRDRRAPTRASASTPRISTASSSRSTAAFARGTGLGLSIVHRIVSDYGGELVMTSARGKGTTVTVRLPAAERAAEESLKSDVGSREVLKCEVGSGSASGTRSGV